MGDLIITEIDIPIATITLNRASRHNSLVPELLAEILDSLDVIAVEKDIRAVILQAKGSSFSTGGDLMGFYQHLERIEEYAGSLVGQLNDVILAMLRLPIPVIGAVHGLVTGGSLGFLLAADYLLVSPEVKIIPYYSVVGFSPDGGWTAMLPKRIGAHRAAEAIMLNRPIGAQDAIDWGLANRIVAAENIRREARSLALKIAAADDGIIANTKRLLQQDLSDLEEQLDAERRQFIYQVSKPETQQSMIQFLDEM